MDLMNVEKETDEGEKKRQYKREMYRKKYNENSDFKKQKLKNASQRYKEDDEFRISLKENNKKKISK